MRRTGILGFGNMGEAICRGLLKSRPSDEIYIHDRSAERTERSASASKVRSVSSARELFAVSDTVILAVKPQDTDSLMREISSLSRGKGIISIIAGRSISYFTENLKTENICRFMPNMAALCGKSLTAVAFSGSSDESFMKEAVSVAESFGNAMIIPEKYMPAATAVSGSGIAFIFQFMHAMSMGGVCSGISYQDSLRMVLATMEGAIETVKSSGRQPLDLVTSVTSPAGTTIEGIRALEEKGFNACVMDAVDAACKRAQEIESLH